MQPSLQFIANAMNVRQPGLTTIIILFIALCMVSVELRGQNQLANGSVNDSIAKQHAGNQPVQVLAGSAQDPGVVQPSDPQTPVIGPGSGDATPPSEENQGNSSGSGPKKD